MAYVANHSSVPRQSVIPTFIDNMPPSPTRKQNNRKSLASGNSRNNKGKRQHFKVTPVSTPTFLPSVVAEQYAEDDRLSYSTQSQHGMASDSDEDTSSDESSPERHTVSSAAISASTVPKEPRYVQVFLQVGENRQIPINIPAEMILPSLVSALGGNRIESVGNGRSSGSSTPVALPAGSTRISSTGDSRQNVTQIDYHKKHPLAGVASSPVAASIPKIPRLSVPATPPVLPSPPPVLRYLGAAPRPAAPPSSTLVHKLPTSASVPLPSYTSTKRELSSESEGEYNKNQQTYSNRAAASRCRQKKKQQIEEMESKTKALQEANKSLEAEMDALKSEIEQYEAALAEHAECSVMQNVYYITPS